MHFDSSEFEDTITVCSFDRSRNVSLINSEIKVINFDKVKSSFSSDHKIAEPPKSVDALAFGSNGEPIFIEFKNKSKDVISKSKMDLTQKIYDSVLLYCDLFKSYPTVIRGYGTYIIVYSEDELNPRQNLIKKSQLHATNKVIHFVNSQLQGWLVLKVLELTQSEFYSYLDINILKTSKKQDGSI